MRLNNLLTRLYNYYDAFLRRTLVRSVHFAAHCISGIILLIKRRKEKKLKKDDIFSDNIPLIYTRNLQNSIVDVQVSDTTGAE
ncbi:hypothetical protein BH10BAC2_BH10BAC2_43120 [soil metagenome]